jgi:hypothetical protein
MNAGLLVCVAQTRPTVFPDAPHTPGNLHRCESKGVAGKAIRKTMKTKGAQNAMVVREAKSRANSEGLTCGNMGQGTTAVYITKGLSIEWRKSGLDGVY